MKIILKTNGKINPIGVCSSPAVKLSVETEGLKVNSICYQVFNSKRDMDKCNAISTMTTDNYHCFVGPLECCKKYYWRASLYSEGKVYTESATFETAMKHSDFTAKWVENPNFDGHVSEVQKTFNVLDTVKKARLYIVGLGFYKSFINGKETDDYYFKPVLTDFSIREGLNNKGYNEDNFRDGGKTVCYNTFDVTDFIKVGENKLSVLLGTGWYCNEDKDITDPSFTYGYPKLIFELHIETKGGKFKVLSDEDCLVRNTAITSQLFACDKIDFTQTKKPFVPVSIAVPPTGTLITNETALDKVIEIIEPINSVENNGVTEYDFGKNHTGGLDFYVKGKRGAKLTVKYFEVKTNGELNPLTSRWVAYEDGKYVVGHLDQVCEYVLSGEEDYITPYFHWSSYRYATIECDAEYYVRDIKSFYISSDVNTIGKFSCSDEFINRLERVFINTQRSNMHCGVPSDCPQREKLPYTGDGNLVAETVTYTLDTENFYVKWMHDIFNAQGKNGYVPYTAPFIAGGGGLWWSNAVAIVPMVAYRLTGNKRLLEMAFSPCMKLVRYYDTKHDGDYIIKGSDSTWCLGDWLTPEVTVLDTHYMNTLAWYFAITETLKISALINDKSEEEYLLNLKDKVRNAINEKYFNKDTCDYAGGIQGANILPAINGVADDDIAQILLKKLVDKYEKDPHFDTGIVLTPKLLDALTIAGRSDVALKVLTEKTGPSYYDMIKGETTLPEHWYKHWPGAPGTNVSHSHPMFGSVLGWVYKNVAGLDLTNLCDKKIIYAPKVVREISWAKMQKITMFGKASIEYQTKTNFNMKIVVPFGVIGEVVLPEYLTDLIVDGKPGVIMEKDGLVNVFNLHGGTHVITGNIK